MSANALYPAILQAMKDFGPVKKDANNPAFRTKYATLQSVLETIEEPLWANGLLLLQRFEPTEAGPVLVTEILHAATGDRISSTLPIVSKDPTDPQKLGGAITYARRYSLLALLGLAPEDDDGNAAAQPRQQATPRQAPAPRRSEAPAPAQRAETALQAAAVAWTKDEFVAFIDGEMARRRTGTPYEQIVAAFGAARPYFTPDQYTDAKEYLRQIKAWTPEGGEQ